MNCHKFLPTKTATSTELQFTSKWQPALFDYLSDRICKSIYNFTCQFKIICTIVNAALEMTSVDCQHQVIKLQVYDSQLLKFYLLK